MYKLIGFLKPYKKECILGPLFKLFEAVLELLLPTIMALVINKGVVQRDINYIIKMGSVMLFMAIIGFCSSLVCQRYAAYASQGVGTKLRNELFEHILGLPNVELDKFKTSSLINRITNDVNQLELAVAMLIRLVVRAPFICIGAIFMAMFLDFKLSLILIATTPIFAVVLYFFITKTTPMYKRYQSKLDKLGGRLGENLLGVRVIRAFASTDYETRRFKEDNNELTESANKISKISALLNPITSIVMNFAIIVLLWISGVQINAGNLSPGTIIAFINYITQILLALIVVSNLVILFVKAESCANRVSEVLQIKSSLKSNQDLESSKEDLDAKAIEFENVSFKYNEEGDYALWDINVTIKKGETIGIIGGTGSGKSTFINLLGRYYDVNNGEILIGGVNVNKYPIKSLRNIIGMVPQKVELFTGTISENITLAKNNATKEEIIKASKIAQADEFISKLEKGYETEILRSGSNFSGGQKQRLTIARAVVKNPKILILDDSSSALDFATDAMLQREIRKNSNEMTVIIVSQRASSLRDCDRILVFDDGQIVGNGTHFELIKKCEVYKQICSSQKGGNEDEKVI